MKESIGYTFTLNLMIVFILLTFAIIMAIMSYSKAFKINNRIMNEIEKCEGFNTCTVSELNRILDSYGYSKGSIECPERDGVSGISELDGLNQYELCVYYDDNINNEIFNSNINNKPKYRYGVLTYYHVDLPLISAFKLPVYTRTHWIYDFNADNGGGQQ